MHLEAWKHTTSHSRVPIRLANSRRHAQRRQSPWHRQTACEAPLNCGSSFRRLEVGHDGLDQLVGSAVKFGRATGERFLAHSPQTARICGRDRYAGKHRALQDFGPFLERETLLVRHGNPF